MSDVTVRLEDLGHGRNMVCRKGARRMFAAYGLDWSSFIRQGIKLSEINKVPGFRDHSQTKAAVERARVREARRGQ